MKDVAIAKDRRKAYDKVGKGPPRTTVVAPPRGFVDLNLREFWRYREILYFFVWRDIKVRYKQTLIGASWAILQPLGTMILFTIFFGQVLGLRTAGLPGPVFYYSTLLPWTYFAGALNSATNVMIENQGVIKKIYFPRLLLPAAAVLPGLLDFFLAFGVLIALMVVYGIAPSLQMLLLPLFLLLTVATAFAAGLWLSVLNATYRDVRYAVPFLIQMWFFVSPVIYPAEEVLRRLPAGLRWLYGLNPLAGAIEGFRWSITGEGSPPELMILVSFAVVLLLLAGGMVFFRRKEIMVADVL